MRTRTLVLSLLRRGPVLSTLVALAVLALVLVVTATRANAGAALYKGWNNVSYLGGTKPPSEALTPINGQYDAVYRWNAVESKYEVYAPGIPGYVNTLTELRTGDAVWVSLTAQTAVMPGDLTGAAATSGKLSIAASTFQPASDLAIFEKSFNQLNPVGTDLESQRYFAPLVLPDGVKITSMTVAFEATGGAVQVRLDYTPLNNGSASGSVFKLAEVIGSSGGTSPQVAQAFAHTVDNGANVYFLLVDLTGGPGTKLKGVSVAYSAN